LHDRWTKGNSRRITGLSRLATIISHAGRRAATQGEAMKPKPQFKVMSGHDSWHNVIFRVVPIPHIKEADEDSETTRKQRQFIEDAIDEKSLSIVPVAATTSDTITIPVSLAGELGIFEKLRSLGYRAAAAPVEAAPPTRTCSTHGTPLNGDGRCLPCDIASGRHTLPVEARKEFPKCYSTISLRVPYMRREGNFR
jgi:hypothetical protein